jgi:hypothetical protein
LEAFSHGMLNCLPLLRNLRTFSALLIISCMLLGLLARLRHPYSTILWLGGLCCVTYSSTRNRTRGSDFPPFFSPCMTQVPNDVHRCCMYTDLTTRKECSWSWLGTISREATFCHQAGETTLSSLQAPLLLSQAGLASLSTGRDTLPGCARGGHHLAQKGTLEVVAEIEVRQQGEGRMLPLHVHERSGNLVLASAERLTSCLEYYGKSYARHFRIP